MRRVSRIETVGLRPWRAADAETLAAAWADPDIARWTAVPEDRSVEAAARWIGGWDERRRRGLALDLVVTPADDDAVVWGEVGVAFVTDPPTMGWWVRPDARGRGVATAAVRRFVEEFLTADEVVAEVDEANPASVAVARAAGFETVTRGRMVLRYHRRRP
jgi:RimJ/RimL family protein N-acetyltransferase